VHGRYRQTDRQDYYGNTALCTILLRAVKTDIFSAFVTVQAGTAYRHLFVLKKTLARIISEDVRTLCLKNGHRLLLNNSAKIKLTDFNDFWYMKSGENFTSTAHRFAHLTCKL